MSHLRANLLRPRAAPLTFLVTHTAEPQFAPDVLILTGICWRYAEKSDAERLKYGSELTAQLLRGRVQGFEDSVLTIGALSVPASPRGTSLPPGRRRVLHRRLSNEIAADAAKGLSSLGVSYEMCTVHT